MKFPEVFDPAVLVDIQGRRYCRWVLYATRGEALQNLWYTILALHIVMPPSSDYLGMYAKDRDVCDTKSGLPGQIHIYLLEPSNYEEMYRLGIDLMEKLEYRSVYGSLRLESASFPPKTLASLPTPSRQFRAPISFSKDANHSALFDVPQHMRQFAFHLGARWNDAKQHYIAPTTDIGRRLASYFPQVDEEKTRQNLFLFAQSDARILPAVCDNSPFYSVFSLNVCFHLPNTMERMLALFATLQGTLPDIICLQEVTQEAFGLISPLLETIDYTTRSIIPNNKPFGEVLLVRTKTFRLVGFEQVPLVPFSSHAAQRDIHIAELECVRTKKCLRSATMHLQASNKGSEMRRKQLLYVLDTLRLREPQLPFLCIGDLNLSTNDTYVPRLLAQQDIGDAWEHCGGLSKCKNTWNSSRNSVLQESEFKEAPHRRFDRVLFTKRTIRALEFELRCTQKIPLISQHISDHFAIMSRLQMMSGIVCKTGSVET